MFKRVERKRKKREEEEELQLDEALREIMGLNDTDSDESESSSGSEHDTGDDAQNDTESEEEVEVEDGEGIDQEDEAASEDEEIDEEPPITVAEASKNPLYLISMDPIIHGCVLCKGKLIKSIGMAAAHKNANAHKRRFEQFTKLAVGSDPQGDAWELVRAIRSASDFQNPEPQELSKRALKRQAKQASIREKRERHQELKVKAIAKKATNKLAKSDKASRLASTESLPSPPVPQAQSENPRKKQKLQRKTSAGTIKAAREVRVKGASSTNASTDGKTARKSRVHPHTKRAGKAHKESAS